MNRIKNKLRSRTGASITFALLLFLVCAVLCSVILSAATAASGRMAGIAQTDQRYYAVTSACEMMRDMVGGEDSAVTVVKKTTTKSTTKYVDGAVNGSSVTETTNAYTVKTASSSGDYTEGEFKADPVTLKSTEAIVSTLMSAAISIYKTSANTAGDASMTDASSVWPRSITIASSETLKSALGEELTVDPLAVTILAGLDKSSGKLTLTVYNTTTEDTGDRFTQIMVFSMDKTTGGLPQEEVSSTEPATTTDGHISYNVKTTTTTYETTTYTWTLDSIETKMATPSET